jgi:integrase
MPKKVKELSAAEVRRLTYSTSSKGIEYNALHSVGGVSGLLLQVTPTGAKSWILRTTVGTKRRNIGLGPFPEVSLASARDKASTSKEMIVNGLDPVEEKNAIKRALITSQLSQITFDIAARDYIKMKAKEFRNPRQEQQWTNSLATYASPHIGSMPVSEIELSHIKSVLDPIWETKTDTATRVRSRLENILGWCAIHGYRKNENPARWSGYLDEIYPSFSKVKKRKHHSSLSILELHSFMTSLREREGVAPRALEFLILTASRTNEVIGDKRIGKPGITWAEIDLQKRVWTVPAERMKSNKIHTVPLCKRALAIVSDIPEGKPTDLLFNGSKGGIPSNNFLSSLLKRMDVEATTHGFRSTFKDWCREYTSYADEVSELSLAHVNSDATRAAYARSELIDKRRLLMSDWEYFCQHGVAKNMIDNKVIGIGALINEI